MIEFPTTTIVHKRMPKEAFYKHLSLTKVLKDKFISDIDRIVVENSLTNETLNLTTDSKIKEIMLLSINFKKQDYDSKIIEAIAKQNSHRLVFLLVCGDSYQLALYQGKLYQTEWINYEDIKLQLKGFSLDEMWDSFIEQIALQQERSENVDGLTIDERLELQEQILKLENLIDRTEKAAWKEEQPKKKFKLYTRLQEYKKQLEELKQGNLNHNMGQNNKVGVQSDG